MEILLSLLPWMDTDYRAIIVRLSLSTESANHSAMFFFHNKSAHSLSTKQICSMVASLYLPLPMPIPRPPLSRATTILVESQGNTRTGRSTRLPLRRAIWTHGEHHPQAANLRCHGVLPGDAPTWCAPLATFCSAPRRVCLDSRRFPSPNQSWSFLLKSSGAWWVVVMSLTQTHIYAHTKHFVVRTKEAVVSHCSSSQIITRLPPNAVLSNTFQKQL